MSSKTLSALKIVLWFVCLSHIILGAAIMLSPEFQQRVAALYSAKVDWTPQFVYILRPLGAFMLVLGMLGIAAARNPLRYQFVVYGFAGLLLIRVVQRLVFQRDIHQAFGIEPSRNTINALAFLALAALLVALLQIAKRQSAPSGDERGARSAPLR